MLAVGPPQEFIKRRLSAVQRRYTRALETLARVWKINRSIQQINIAMDGGKQVNVAGEA